MIGADFKTEKGQTAAINRGSTGSHEERKNVSLSQRGGAVKFDTNVRCRFKALGSKK